MRIDKFLKVARVIKRRTVANEVVSKGRVQINGRAAKPSTEVKVGDIIEIQFGSGTSRIRVLEIKESVRKDDAASLYEVVETDPLALQD